MSSVVFRHLGGDCALARRRAGSEVVAAHVGQAAMSTVNLQELVKALLLRGLTQSVIEEMVQELRLDLHAHDREAAFAAPPDQSHAPAWQWVGRPDLHGISDQARRAIFDDRSCLGGCEDPCLVVEVVC